MHRQACASFWAVAPALHTHPKAGIRQWNLQSAIDNIADSFYG